MSTGDSLMNAATFHRLPISRIEPETDHAVRITFDVPDPLREQFRFKQGQYLTLECDIDGAPVRRSYSICSGVKDPELQVAIKRVDNGVFSNFANDSLRAGDAVRALPPEGSFYTDLDPSRAGRYLFIAAGSGITPVISNIRSVLGAEPASHVALLFGNQRTSTIMFRDDLSFLKNRYMSRFMWVNILSREDQGSELLNGRLDNRKGAELGRRLLDLTAYDEYFICGPESMISEVSRGLRGVGVSEDRIHYELFASSAEDAERILRKHQERATHYGDNLSSVMLIADGRSSSFELSTHGENILDAGLNQGLDLPYSCKAGVCSTCKAKLLEGEVDMDITHGLQEGEIDRGLILTCQAHPVTARVVLDFDQK